MNLFAFTGNLGGDAEVKDVGGSKVLKFSVAVTSGFGDKKQTAWYGCDVWGKQAESRLVDYLKKGQQVAVTGELSHREYDGKTFHQVRVNSIDLVGGKGEHGSAPAPSSRPVSQQAPATAPAGDGFDDDIPFADPYRGSFSLIV